MYVPGKKSLPGLFSTCQKATMSRNTKGSKPMNTQATPAPTDAPVKQDETKDLPDAPTGGEKAVEGQATNDGAAQDGASESNGTDGQGSTEGQGGAEDQSADGKSTEVIDESAATKAAEPVATARDETTSVQILDEVASQETAADESSEVDRAIETAILSPSTHLAALGRILKAYRANMGKSKATDAAVVIEQNCQLWSVLRSMLKSGEGFRDCMNFVLMVFRDNNDGAFTLPLLLRGIDDINSRLDASHRAGYTGLVSVIEAAASMENPKQVSRVINLTAALNSEVFSSEARQRVIGFFSS